MPSKLSSSAVLCLLAARCVWGQAVTGSLVGTIQDQTGAVVPNAKVTLTETQTAVSRVTNSNQSGNYSFTNLPAGAYKVEVEQAGFRKAVKSGLDVLVNSTVRADVDLQTGQVNESIDVTAETAILQTDRSDTGRKIETRQLADMPLTYNRNFQGLVNLVPGAIRAFRPHSEFFNAQDSLSTRVNGQSRLSNNVQLEGVDNNHRTGLLTALIPPIEALQAVDITTSNYEAELGRAGGAVMNVNFKSGTNELHGSVFEFNRVSRLGARSFFATRKPVTTYNQFGFTIGGPIFKNKTFFFGDYQGLRDRRGDIHRGTIPTAEFRRGDLSRLPAGTAATQVYDPATGNADGTGRLPMAGNIIPANRISPIAARILGFIPAPNLAGSTNFETSTTRIKDADSFDIKLDHNLGDNDKIAIRHSFQKPKIFEAPLYGVQGGGFRDFAGTGIQESHNAQVNYTHIFTPTIISELRVGFMYYRNNADNADRGTKTASEIGIPGVNVSDFTGGISNIVINGLSNPVVGYSPSLPWERGEQNFNFIANVTWIRGNHTIKVGADHRRNRDELLQNQTFSPRGRFAFVEGTTQLRGTAGVANSPAGLSNAFASFLLDRPNQSGRDLPIVFPAYLQKPFFTYVQDKWQVNPKLTLDLGLRHEMWPPAIPRVRGGFANYNPANNTLEVAGVGNVPLNLGRKNYYTNFAPRFGAAYRHNDKTVVRMGYGISFAPLVDNGYAFNFPVRENNVLNANSAFEAAGSMAQGFPAFVPFPIPDSGIIQIPRTGGLAALSGAHNYVRPDVRESYVQSWNIAVQRMLPKQLTLEVAYVGNHGVGIMATQNLNAGLVAGAGAAGQPLNIQFGRTAATNNIYFGTHTNYNSAQVKLDRRFANGFALTTAYTWAKALDVSGADNGGLWVHINPERNRAVADGNRTHVFVQSYIYELPFGKGKPYLNAGPGKWLLGGWQLNGILTVMTGEPFNLSVPGSVINAPSNANTPNMNGAWKTPKVVGPEASSFWFDPALFSQPASNTFGALGRNRLTGPGFFHLDFSTFRKFEVSERIKVEFRAEAFNLSNTPKFNNPNGDITSPNFGKVTGVNGEPNGPRVMQLGLKMVF